MWALLLSGSKISKITNFPIHPASRWSSITEVPSFVPAACSPNLTCCGTWTIAPPSKWALQGVLVRKTKPRTQFGTVCSHSNTAAKLRPETHNRSRNRATTASCFQTERGLLSGVLLQLTSHTHITTHACVIWNTLHSKLPPIPTFFGGLQLPPSFSVRADSSSGENTL